MSADLITELEKIASFPNVSGNEKTLVDYLKRLAAPLADKIYIDSFGNLICLKGENFSNLVAFAHVDKIGFMVSARGKTVKAVGLFEDVEDKLRKDESSLVKVLSKSGELSARLQKVGNKIMLAGVDPSKLQVGDYITYKPNFRINVNGKITSQGLDNSLGVLSALHFLHTLKSGAVVFSIQEEMGFYGAAAAAQQLKPKRALIVDVTYADDPRSSVKLGGGISFCLKDNFISDREMVMQATELCQDKEIKYQLEVLTSGKSDIAGVFAGFGPVPHLFVEIPVSGMHTSAEQALYTDFDAAVKFLSAYNK